MGFLVAMLIVGGVLLFTAVWIGLDMIIQKRKEKPAKKMVEQEEPKQEAQKPEKMAEPEFDVEGSYIQAVAINNRAKEHLQLIWLKTKAASPDEVLCDALHFYAEIVNMYGPGDQLVIYKASGMQGIILKFPPLERIEKKVES